MDAPPLVIILFVKAPSPGRVKTRIAAVLGPEAAAEIYKEIVAEVSRCIPKGSTVIICYDPPSESERIKGWLAPLFPSARHWLAQQGETLGQRLANAFSGTFSLGYEKALVIGTDCIGITPQLFDAAWNRLQRGRCVIGPATDGGYYLLGLAANEPRLFEGVPWSSSETFGRTVSAAKSCGLQVELLPELSDIDTVDDLSATFLSHRVFPAGNRKGMHFNAPISFTPLFMERVWGARRLESLYGKPLPAGSRYGESWELVDREEAQSIVAGGELAGISLHDLWVNHRRDVFGSAAPASPRFPLLIKLLDCADVLSVQVHPPAAVAPRLGGEPKTECWYIADAESNSNIFVGLKRGVTRDQFEKKLSDGTVAECLHSILTKKGDAIFIPSGRVHAIGAGNVIVEVQQNSDTTYRVFDFNRVGLDGKKRELHIEQSLESICFDDPEPSLAEPTGETVISCDLFVLERWNLQQARPAAAPDQFAIFTVLEGEVTAGDRSFKPGEFFLIPAAMADKTLRPSGKTTVLRTTFPA